jgi:hypothetical protein
VATDTPLELGACLARLILPAESRSEVARKAQSVFSKSLVLTTTVARTTAVARVSEKKLQKQSKTLVKSF